MKIISWNVNGIRAAIKKGFLDFVKKQNPDVVCLQEIKISDTARSKEKFDFSGYKEFWNSADRPGYSGTAMLLKEDYDFNILPKLDWDGEGRIQILDTEKYYLINVYFPNANHELSRLRFKLDFNNRLLEYLKKLKKIKPLIITGDFNVAHKEIDLARPRDNEGNPGFTREERGWMDKFLANGYTDTFRHFCPNEVKYTWWSYRPGVREKNIGWRIDYICVTSELTKKVAEAFIWDRAKGSDHCPIGIEIDS